MFLINFGKISAALPIRPIDNGFFSSLAFNAYSIAFENESVFISRYCVSNLLSIRLSSTSTVILTPSFIVTANGCAPPMPPNPAVSVSVPFNDPLNSLLAISASVSYVPCKIPCVPI